MSLLAVAMATGIHLMLHYTVTDSTLEKEMAGLAPGVKIINMDSIESGPPIPQKKGRNKQYINCTLNYSLPQ